MDRRGLFCAATLALLQVGLPDGSRADGQRIALVIGNADYASAPLSNPVRDASDVSDRLEALGFDVISTVNADLRTMQARFLEFIEQIEQGATAMVYYAGHGIQANGRNYLLPVDASFESEQMLRFEALEVSDILEELERSGSSINLVVLDACRNNPFEAQYRGGSRGLAVMDAAAGTLIAYATAPGSVASDGDGDENGLYTQAFLNALNKPGLKVEEVFKQVRIEVSDASRGKQIPWESSSLTGDFVFNAAATSPAAAQPVSVSPERVAEDVTRGEPADEGICDDLSGRWVSRSEATGCGSEFWLTKTADDTYRMTMTLCNTPMFNKVTGETVIDGRSLTTTWKAASCSGVTTGEFAANCRTARAEPTPAPA